MGERLMARMRADGSGTHQLIWLDHEQRRADPAAGHVYRLETNATGRPAAPFVPDPDRWRGFTAAMA